MLTAIGTWLANEVFDMAFSEGVRRLFLRRAAVAKKLLLEELERGTALAVGGRPPSGMLTFLQIGQSARH